MALAWRIVKEKYAASAFSGEGAARTGGRWNSRGSWVVYASSSRSLAVLETLVHLNPPVHFRYVLFRAEFADDLIEKFPVAKLPGNWREEPMPPGTREIGDLWLRGSRSAVLELPSVVIPEESNYLINPAHPNFRRILIRKAEPFAFDPRLVG